MKNLFYGAGKMAVMIFLFTPLFFMQVTTVSAAAVCTNLSSDVSYGQTDAYSGGPITMLQNFLGAEGYMNVASNGHFGPATLAGVVSFQTAKDISSTGYVGPLTRTAIATLSCNTSSVSVVPVVASPIGVASNPSVAFSNVITPAASTTLSLGRMYTITWNGAPRSAYDIVLEDQNGLGQGFITPNAQTSGSYNWQVGSVLSSVSNTYTTVGPGTYQIHLYTVSGGTPDIYSNTFTITAPPLVIKSLTPFSISASENQTLVLYGSGFNSSTEVSIDGYYSNSANILYASPDGTVLVFSLPANISVGEHTLYISNAYGSLASSALFTVTQ